MILDWLCTEHSDSFFLSNFFISTSILCVYDRQQVQVQNSSFIRINIKYNILSLFKRHFLCTVDAAAWCVTWKRMDAYDRVTRDQGSYLDQQWPPWVQRPSSLRVSNTSIVQRGWPDSGTRPHLRSNGCVITNKTARSVYLLCALLDLNMSHIMTTTLCFAYIQLTCSAPRSHPGRCNHCPWACRSQT